MNGFVRVAAACPTVALGDPRENARRIAEAALRADAQGAAVLLTPRMSLTGATIGDLRTNMGLLALTVDALDDLARDTRDARVSIVVELPFAMNGNVYEATAIVQGGRIQVYLGASIDRDAGADMLPHPHGQGRHGLSSHGIMSMGYMGGGRGEGDAGDWRASGIAVDIHPIWPVGDVFAVVGTARQHRVYNDHEAALCLVQDAAATQAGSRMAMERALCEDSLRDGRLYLYANARGESTTDGVYAGGVLAIEEGHVIARAEEFLIVDLDAHTSRFTRNSIDIGTIANALNPGIRYGRPGNIDMPPNGDGDARDGGDRCTTGDVAAGQTDCTFGDAPNDGAANPRANAQDHNTTPPPLLRTLSRTPYLPDAAPERDAFCEEVLDLQSRALAQRAEHVRAERLHLAVSGGLDSTMALLCAVRAADRLGMPRTAVVGVTMPGFGTSSRTKTNAESLMEALGVTLRRIDIRPACEQHFRDLGMDPGDRGVAFENAQARERTQVLMDMANLENGLMVGTGNLSELALGFTTYNGDHMSMYAVNAGIPKTALRALAAYAARTMGGEIERVLLDILDTPISPELLPGDGAQHTERIVGPYELHDYALYRLLRYGESLGDIAVRMKAAFAGAYADAEIDGWLDVFRRRFVAQQFKRSCMPDGPDVMGLSLSPREGFRMPSDARGTALGNA